MTQPAPAPPTTAPPAPAPTPPPTPPAPPAPAPPAPAGQFAPGQPPQTGQQPPAPTTPPPGQRPTDPATGDDGLPYYQEGVPWRQLPPDQQVAYWMHRSRKHEDRVNAMRDYDELRQVKNQYDQLLAQSQTEHERAVAEARRQGESAAMARANTMLVEAYVRSAAAARGVDEEAVTDFLDTTRLDAFINAATGQVDTAKVYRQVNRMAAPAPQGVPAGVPAAPAAVVPPMNGQVPQPPAQPGWPQQQVAVPGQPAPAAPTAPYGQQQWYGQPAPPAAPPAAPAWPGQIPAAPSGAPGQPAAGPDFGQGQFPQAPPSGLEAGRAAARARFAGQNSKTTNSQA